MGSLRRGSARHERSFLIAKDAKSAKDAKEKQGMRFSFLAPFASLAFFAVNQPFECLGATSTPSTS